MKLFRVATLMMAATQMVLAPVHVWANEQKPSPAPVVTTDNQKKENVITTRDENGNIKSEIVVPYSNEEQLAQYEPETLNANLKQEQSQFKNLRAATGAAISHSAKNLLPESSLFFIAMGGVIALQLVTDYSANPEAMKDHIENQMSPVGVLSFGAFTATQGITSNVLTMYTHSPQFQALIPYLGMSAGAFVQGYISQMAADPNVIACSHWMAKNEVTQADKDAGADEHPCRTAYQAFTSHQKFVDAIPSLLSMTATSAIMAGVNQGIRMTGIELITWLVPGGLEVKGLRYLFVNGLQITAFTALNDFINNRVNYVWKNQVDGAELSHNNIALINKMNEIKRSQWSSSEVDLANEINDFHNKMMSWRAMNMSDVYEAHQNWVKYLTQLTALYNSSFLFYTDFTNELRSAKFKQTPSPALKQPAPLNGVIAKGLTAGNEDLYFTFPERMASRQTDTLDDAAAAITAFLKTNPPVYKTELAQLQNIQSLLAKSDVNKKAQGLIALNQALTQNQRNITVSGSFIGFLRALYTQIGHPQPVMEPGHGYMLSFEQSPTNIKTLQDTAYYRNVGLFQTPHISEYFLMQMICGPDVEKNERVVRTSKGFQSVFLAPKIQTDTADFERECQSVRADAIDSNIYSWPITTRDGKKYTGFISYLLDNTRGSVLGTDPLNSGFNDWWQKTTSAQLQAAITDFQHSYEKIVVKLMQHMYSNDISVFNAGPVDNGMMNASFQEERVYLSILSDIMNPAEYYDLNIATLLKQKSPSQPVLYAVEHQFALLNGLMKQIKIVTKDGRPAIQGSIENAQLDQQVSQIQTAINQVSVILGVSKDSAGAQFNLTPQQRVIAASCLANLNSLAGEISMYGKIANAVSWDKVANLKSVDPVQQKFNNMAQKELAQSRGISLH